MKKFTIILYLCTALFVFASAQNNMIINPSTGSSVGIPLSGIKKITFASGTMNVLNTNAVVQSYLLTDIATVTFGIWSDVSDVAMNNVYKIFPTLVDNVLYCQINNPIESAVNHLYITSLSGVVMFRTEFTSSQVNVDFSTFAPGVYLVNLNGSVQKVIKK